MGEGVSELRIDYGPGYRVYFKQQSRTIVVLLAGGDKRTQSRGYRDGDAARTKPVGGYHEQDRYFTL